jgi:hypothetical protein
MVPAMEVLERLLDLLPGGLVDLAYEAMALDLHVFAGIVATLMLVTALSLAALLHGREQLVELAADHLVAGREHQSLRIGAELVGMVGGPLERGPAGADLAPDREHDRGDADAELGAYLLNL